MDTLQIHEDLEIAKTDQSEEEGISAIKLYIAEYLRDDVLNTNSCPEVRNHIEKAKSDDKLLLKYLKGRKGDPVVAWDSLRRYAENKFKNHPEVFPAHGIPDKARQLLTNHVVGVLKHTDKFGRKIVFVDQSKWDVNLYSVQDVTTVGVVGAERFWKDPEILEKGLVFLENTKGFGLGHLKLHSIHSLNRMRNVFLHSFPISVQGFYYLHMPATFSTLLNMSKPLFPKKIRSRMFTYSSNQTPNELYDIASIEILPTWAGGKLPVEEAAEDISFFEPHFDQSDQTKK